jgi:hypothetical protein
MSAIARARKLANYIRGIDGFLADIDHPTAHGHIGATMADAVLQAGLNYRIVVLPRVERVKRQWPRSRYLSGFRADLAAAGPFQMLNWNHDEKPRRLMRLVQLLGSEAVESEEDLRIWISSIEHQDVLLQERGIGPKTVDYLARLVGGSTVAVDRHIIRFVAKAHISCSYYDEVRQVVCYAADLLGIQRPALDHAIWRHMADAPGRLRAA